MSEKLSIEEVVHILERDHKFKIYKRGNKYSVWRKKYCWCKSNKAKDLYTARQVHQIYGGYLDGVPWNDILKQQTHSVSRRIIRDAINTEEFERIPQHGLPFMDDPWKYD